MRPHPSSLRIVMALALAVGAAGMLLTGQPAGGGAGEGRRDTVLATKLDGPVTPIMADHLQDALGRAEDDGYAALVVEIDTPGGLVTSMRSIIQAFLDADVPVLAFVTPAGGQAASAGALIAWSSHLVAMSPGTTIGAATPVDLEGGEVGDKIVEDAAAYARAVAEERGYDIETVASAVTDGRAFSASEALELGVADLRVDSLEELLVAADGTEVVVADGSTVVLGTADADVDRHGMSWLRSILQFLADPNVAFILMSIGTLGIIYELANPGEWIAGGIGVTFVLLSLVSVAVLPVEVAGFLFLGLAIALFAAEIFAPGIGVAAVLGAIALVLAGVFMFREEGPGVSLSLTAVIPTAVILALGVILAGRLALRARARTPVSGSEHLVGAELRVAEATGTTGQARLEGSWWRLKADRPLETGALVRVAAVDGIDLVVEPLEAGSNVDREEQT